MFPNFPAHELHCTPGILMEALARKVRTYFLPAFVWISVLCVSHRMEHSYFKATLVQDIQERTPWSRESVSKTSQQWDFQQEAATASKAEIKKEHLWATKLSRPSKNIYIWKTHIAKAFMKQTLCVNTNCVLRPRLHKQTVGQGLFGKPSYGGCSIWEAISVCPCALHQQTMGRETLFKQ